MTESPSDQQLVTAVAEGDRSALAALFHRLPRGCWCGYPDAVRIKASWRKRSRTPSSRCGGTLVPTRVGARLRPGSGASASGVSSIAFAGLATSNLYPPGRPDVVVSAEDQVLLGVEFGDLAGALDRLSPELRAVVQATVIDGLTTKEAGALLGIPAGTVKTRMMRARAQLREELT